MGNKHTSYMYRKPKELNQSRTVPKRLNPFDLVEENMEMQYTIMCVSIVVATVTRFMTARKKQARDGKRYVSPYNAARNPKGQPRTQNLPQSRHPKQKSRPQKPRSRPTKRASRPTISQPSHPIAKSQETPHGIPNPQHPPRKAKLRWVPNVWFSLQIESTEDRWYLDSGCTCHMTGFKDVLSDFQHIEGGTSPLGTRSKGESLEKEVFN